MLKRGFKGDADIFVASVSEDGKIMVVLDTRKDEKVGGVVTTVYYILLSFSSTYLYSIYLFAIWGLLTKASPWCFMSALLTR